MPECESSISVKSCIHLTFHSKTHLLVSQSIPQLTKKVYLHTYATSIAQFLLRHMTSELIFEFGKFERNTSPRQTITKRSHFEFLNLPNA